MSFPLERKAGLGITAWSLPDGKDDIAGERRIATGRDEPQVIAETSLCVSDPEVKTRGDFLHGCMSLYQTGATHYIRAVAGPGRIYRIISICGSPTNAS